MAVGGQGDDVVGQGTDAVREAVDVQYGRALGFVDGLERR
jgi:hypothetical protein